jgi:hypothetical protein
MKWKGRVKCVVKVGNAYRIMVGKPQESGRYAVVQLVESLRYKQESGFDCR